MANPLQWLSSLFQPQIQTTFYGHELAAKQPEWYKTAQCVAQCVGSVGCNGVHIGWALLFGVDRVVIPFHLVDGSCPQLYTVTFGGPCGVDTYKILGIFLSAVPDCVVVQLSTGKCDPCSFPGQRIRFQTQIVHTNTSQELMLVHGDRSGERIFSIGQLFKCGATSGGLCSKNETVPGSSGGTAFVRAGYPAVIHLGRSTGVCSDAQERQTVSVVEVLSSTYFLFLPPCQPLPPPVAPLDCLPYIGENDRCYLPEGRKPPVHETNIEFLPAIKRGGAAVKGSCTELRFAGIPSIGDDPRGINFTFPGVNVNYLFTTDPHAIGDYIASNFKDASRLYGQATVRFRDLYQQTEKAPTEFTFNCYGTKFKAQTSLNVGNFTTHLLHGD